VKVLDGLPENARVAVVRLRSLGDCVLTTPALSILKKTRPDLQIGIVVEPRFAAVFEGNPDVSALLNPTPSALFRYRPELCLNLHGGTRSMWMTAASAAPVRAGFAHHKASWIYNRPIPRAQQILGEERPVHTAEHLASAIFHLGAPLSEIPRASLFADPQPRRAPYAVIHPVAATPAKTWRAQGFKSLAEHLRREHNLEPVFIAGPGDDLAEFSSFHTIVGAPLRQTKSLLQGASLFIGNDSGPAHMAAAFGLPVVVLFGPSDPIAWAPWRTANEVLTGKDDIQRISPQDVIHAVDRLKVRA
jgi:ADP-heptose:LPS heptosyltransferase